MFSSNNQISTLSHEQAYEEVEKMENVDRHVGEGCDIVRGNHPVWGPTVLVFPMAGDVVNVPIPQMFAPEIMAIKNVTSDFDPLHA